MAASAMRASGSRTGSAKWGRPRPMTVAHPMATRSLNIDLTVMGTPTPGLMSAAASPRILEWPRPSEKVEIPHRGRRPMVSKSTVWRSNDDLVDMVKEKLTQGLDGVRQMFRAKDPYGGSIVSPEGLFQIVRTLVGHISREQFDSFMKAICLHWRSSISFDEFIVRFADNPAVALYSTTEAIRKGKQPDNIEDNLRSTTMLEWCPFTSAPHAFVVFRRRLQKGEVNIRDIFPPACFVKDGRIIQPQLRDALAKMDIKLTDKEFYNLWQKFDPDYNGSIPVKRFYKTLDLKTNGLPKTQHVPPRSAQSVRSTGGLKQRNTMENRFRSETHTSSVKRENTSFSVSKVNSFEILGDKAELLCQEDDLLRPILATSLGNEKVTTTEVHKTTEQLETTTTTTKRTTTTESTKKEEQLVDDVRLSAHVQSLISKKKATPKFDSAMDLLHYKETDNFSLKFEESYRSLQSAFQLFDIMNDGYVTRIDFRRVLKEFGFDVNAIDLDAFLQRAGIAVIQGLVNYNQFLKRFQAKTDSSIANRVLTRDEENSTVRKKHIKTEETVRIDNMETSVSNFFQNDYNKLLSMLQDRDKNNTGAVPAHELRGVINSVLKTNMTDREFEELVVRLTQRANNDTSNVNYGNFLDLFSAEPGGWNRKNDGMYVSQKYLLGDIPPPTPVLRLQEKAKTWMAIPPTKDHPTDTRISEIKRDLNKLFTDRFHIFDKNFKEMDRRRTGYMSKWQFGACLKLSGVTMSIPDLDYLWSILDIAADNTLGYATLVKTFCTGGKNKAEQVGANVSRPTSKASVKKEDGGSKQDSVKVMIIQKPQLITGSAKERKLTSLLMKVKEDVMQRWDVLHSVFLSLDKHGYSTISVRDMREIAHKLKFSLSEKEQHDLINYYDLQANGWFNYMSFMQAVKGMQPARNVNPYVFDVHTKRLHNKASPTSRALTLHDVLVEMKEILLKKHKTLRGSFKAFDMNGNGYIEEGELKQSMTSLGYHLCPQDFTDILQLFDKSQRKAISFQDFKDTLLAL